MSFRKALVFKSVSLLVVFLFLLSLPSVLSPVYAVSSTTSIHRTIPRNAPIASAQGAFAFVSNFETKTLEGWQVVSGASPSISTKQSYSGEPSLASSATKGTQVDTANNNFILGDSFISFQVAIDAGKGSGYFGLADSGANPVALVGVSNGKVLAGPNFGSLETIEAVPEGTAYPPGWVYIAANVYDASTFYGTYTQLEFQPCCATFPIQDYQINGELYNMQITTVSGQTQSLNSNYMLPFVLDTPTSWDFTYFQNSVLGYQQLS